MSGKCRPSLREKTLKNVNQSNLSQTDKDCIKAVFERFTPKKLKTEIHFSIHPGRFFYYSYHCPSCNAIEEKAQKGFVVPAIKNNYCHSCGQALDWSDIE